MKGMRKMMMMMAGLILLGESLWVDRAPIPTRRSDMSCTAGTERIYLAGGCASDQVYEANYSACDAISQRLDAYSPASDTWESLAPMPRARHRHVALFSQNKLFLFGGRDTNDVIVSEVDVYNVGSNQWSTLSLPFNYATSDLAGYILGGKAILSGGYVQDYSHSNLTHAFDFSTETFEYGIAEMTRGRGDVCGEAISDRGFTYGGFEQTDFCAPVDFVEEFNLQARTWTGIRTFNDVTNGGDGACFAYQSRFFVIGGESKDGRCYSLPLSTAESYDPISDAWSDEPDFYLPEGRFRFCGVNYNNQIFIFGGQGPLENKQGEESHSLLALTQVFVESSASLSTPLSFSLLLVSTLAVMMLLGF